TEHAEVAKRLHHLLEVARGEQRREVQALDGRTQRLAARHELHGRTVAQRSAMMNAAMAALPRTVRAPRGTTLSAKSWLTEAPLRMLMNNLDPEVAERPEELVVYGGI